MKSLRQDFEKQQLKVGRDTLFNVLREHKMLTLRKKYSARTTNSYHRFYKYNKIIKDLKVNRPNQVWVSVTHPTARKKILKMRSIFEEYEPQMIAFGIIAEK